MKLIDKDKLVAKINELKEHFVNERDDFEKGYHSSLNAVCDYLDTLEVKKMDPDELSKELDKAVEIEEIKKRLQRKKAIDTVINIAQDKGTRDQKICEIRDYLLHAITGFYWDEVESDTMEG